MNVLTPAQDYGEPWFVSVIGAISDGNGICIAPCESIMYPHRVNACVNACAGMADPEREIQEMRQSLSGCTVSCGQCNEEAKERDEMREALKPVLSYLQSIEECLDSLARIGRMPTGGENSGNWEHCVQSHKFTKDAIAKLELFLK